MSERECKCSMRTKLLGDGCSVCNPQQALEYALDNTKELEQQRDELESLLLGHNRLHICNITKSVRIEYGKVGKEGLSEIVSHDGTLSGLAEAIAKAGGV